MHDAKKPLLIWCKHCGFGYGAVPGPLPTICPNSDCELEADWTTTPPYHLTRDDKHFLKVIRIRP